MALKVVELLQNKNAKVLFIDDKIKPGKQTKRFNLKKIIIIKSRIKIGTAKVTVGLKKSGQYIEYCVTDFNK